MTSTSLIIQENERFELENYQLEILSYLGFLSPGVHYFKVHCRPIEKDEPNQLGLLRVGSLESGLNRELELRKVLTEYGMIAPLLSHSQVSSVQINPATSPSQTQLEAEAETDTTTPETENSSETSTEEELSQNSEPQNDINNSSETSTEEEPSQNSELQSDDNPDYLEEEYYPEEEIAANSSLEKLLLLTPYPQENATLATWIKQEHSLEESLSIAIQICQCFSYVLQRKWCFVDLLPQLIEIGKPLKFFDLTTAHPLEQTPASGLTGAYCAPELVQAPSFNELMSTYTVGALLYQLTHQKLPQPDLQLTPTINPIPRIHQILKISLSPLVEERFPLSQLLSLLVETRNLLRTPKIHWDIASRSTIGLSTQRLQNEDNYGVKQHQLSNSESLILGAVADGMGGMALGEIASKIAIQTVLEEPIPSDIKTPEQWTKWLNNLFEKANAAITKQIKNGGTTLSVVLAINNILMTAHVGDSRIYLLRKEEIKQLSEDHTMVAMLVASGQITLEESLEHPDRNILTKSLGEKQRLSAGYIQDLTRTTEQLSLTLEDGDILLLCSDGVWDLVPTPEVAEIFTNPQSLQAAVDITIDKVLDRGASDNATLLALQCRLDNFC
jgi:protein phosphatase